jgi:hypothetical protein
MPSPSTPRRGAAPRAAEAPAPPLYRSDPEPVAFFRSVWPLLIVLGVAAAVRVAQYFIARAGDPSFGFCIKGVDTYTYDQWAQDILKGDWWSKGAGRGVFYYGPVYPYFLALVYGIFGHRYGAAHAAQYAVGVLTAGVAFLGLGKWFSRRVAFVAALGLALCPTTLYYEGTLLSSSLDFFLTALYVWALGSACARLEAAQAGGLRPEAGGGGKVGQASCLSPQASQVTKRESAESPTSQTPAVANSGQAGCLSYILCVPTAAWFVAGLVLGIAAIQRANILLCAAGALAWLWLGAKSASREGRRASPAAEPGRATGSGLTARRRVVLGAVFVAGTLLGVSPATVHNRVFGHQWVLVTSNGPNLLYMGNAHDASGTFDYPPSFNDLTKAAKTSPVSMSHELVRDIAAHSGAWVALLAKKVYLFWAGYDPPDNFSYDLFRRFSPLLRWNPLGFGLIAPLALVGMLLSARAWRRVAGLHGFVWTFCASVAVVFVVGRYRLPVVCALAGFASLAAWRAWGWARGGQVGRAAGVVAGAVAAGLLLSAYAVYPLRIRINDYSMAANYFTQAGRPADAAALLEDAVARLADTERRYSAGGTPNVETAAASERKRAVLLHQVRDAEARLLAQANRWGEAEAVLRRILPDGMLDGGEAEMLIVALARQGKVEEARRQAGDMQRRAPQDPRWGQLLEQLRGAGAAPALAAETPAP